MICEGFDIDATLGVPGGVRLQAHRDEKLEDGISLVLEAAAQGRADWIEAALDALQELITQ